MQSLKHLTLGVLALGALAACRTDVAGPDAASLVPRAAATLLGPDETVRVLVDSTDAAGNIIMVAEYAAGIYQSKPGTVASVTIRTVIPGTAASSHSCITSTVQAIETTAGWTASVKKAGGCDKEISVQLDKQATRERATFSFLMVAGKTRIDSGLIR